LTRCLATPVFKQSNKEDMGNKELFVFCDNDGCHICWYDSRGNRQSMAHGIVEVSDAKRLAACWNACMSSTTVQLEIASIYRTEQQAAFDVDRNDLIQTALSLKSNK